MFTYCLNSPILFSDISGNRAVICTRGTDSGRNPYHSDGKGRSDELLDYISPSLPSQPPDNYTGFQLTVTNLGRQYKHTDYSLVQANYIITETVSLIIGGIYPPAGIVLGVTGSVSSYAQIDNPKVFPDGYYDTYSINVSWVESYSHTNGTTNTYYSFEFIVCWDTVSYEDPCWQIHESHNNSYSVTIGN